MPAISVVIPTRDRLAYLREAFGSVQHQTFGDWELIVVDDHSADHTSQWLRDVQTPRLRVLTLDKHGERSAARNLGLQMARGETVLFLDDDDRLRPDALQHMYRGLVREPDAVAAVGGMVRFDARGPLKVAAHVRRRAKRDVWPDVLVGWVGTTGRSLLRTQVVRDIGGFDEGLPFGEDWDMWLRLACAGPVVLLPDPVLEYRVHPGQSRSPDWPEARDARLAEHLARQPPRRAERGRQALRAWEVHRAGLRAQADGDPREAMRLYLRAFRTDRYLYTSPLQIRRMRRPLLGSLMTAPLGRSGLRTLRRVLRSEGASR